MIRRCEDPASSDWEHYGARGIGVYGAWHDLATFVAYLDAELGPCPAGFTMDRIDNERGYEPGNLRWASLSEQNKNRRQFDRRRKSEAA